MLPGRTCGIAPNTGEKEQEILVKLPLSLAVEDQRRKTKRSILKKIQPIEPAESRRNLVLAAHGLLQHFLLDPQGLARQLFLGHERTPECPQSVQQTDRESRARPETRPGRKIRAVMDLEALVQACFAQDRADDRVANLSHVTNRFSPRVDDSMPV